MVGIKESGFNPIFKKLLIESMDITGKKAVVTGHSLGGYQSY